MEIVRILGEVSPGIEEGTETYVDKLKDGPETDIKELVIGIVGGMLEAGTELLALNKYDNDETLIDGLPLVGAADLLDRAELMA